MLTDEQWTQRYSNFDREKLKCSHCGKEGINLEFLDEIQLLRKEYGKPMIETSGFRCKYHPLEFKKDKPGEHADGLAIDVWVPTEDFVLITSLWYARGYVRIGWNPGVFIHLGGSTTRPQVPWIYK